ncbi:hypothetical protein RAS1_36980 [Phycisphaerae bacterium RAS1]|nr:hypothetical protein RAS1_36980 [Phycisphaerae bacterium RAS1]
MDLTSVAEQVLAFCGEDGAILSDDLTQVETAVLEAVRRIGARAVELHLGRQKLGYEGTSRVCGCGGAQRFVDQRPKLIATQMGQIGIRRAYYRCRSCGRSALPYDERVGLGAGAESVGLAKAAALLGIENTFASAASTLHALTGQRLSEATIERLTERVGGVAAQQEQQRAAAMAEWKAPPAEASPETFYVTVDGVQVHQADGWHEAKCVACYWDQPGQPAGVDREVRYGVRFEGAAAFVSFVWELACRCGLERARRVVLLGDGARWIWEHIGGLLKEAVCIVDWYHAMEHVWTCGRALGGEQTPETASWVKSIETLLWDGQVRAILDQLKAERCGTRAKNKRAALQALITYIENQDDRLAYDRFREMGLDIGSGRVEAACKHVVALRMKRCGMRWSKAGSQNVLSLRVAHLNSDWERVWNTRPLARVA